MTLLTTCADCIEAAGTACRHRSVFALGATSRRAL
jgi:hypothetical protein